MKLFIRLLALLGLLSSLLAAGPLQAQTPTGDTLTYFIKSGGQSRKYLVYKPKSYQSGKPVPLVVNFHGQGDIIEQYIPRTKFRQVADANNFLLVYPQALPDPAFKTDKGVAKTTWNTYGTANMVDDAGFIADLLTKVEADYTIDTQRVYATGHSNGGFMSFMLASQLSTRIAAIGSVSGTMLNNVYNYCAPVRPVPVLEIHGTVDPTVPYGGNQWLVSVATLMNKWAQIDGCAPTPTINKRNYTRNGSTTQVVRSVWSTSAGDSTVVHEAVGGAQHDISTFLNFTDSIAIETWRFLRQYRLPTLPSLAPSPNLALNKPVSSSGLENSWLASSAAVDGNPTATRWASAHSDAQWLTVDLGASYNVNRVKITWEASCGKDYDIQVSPDNLTWTSIRSVTGNTPSTPVNDLTGLSGTGRYVRMNGKTRANTQHGYSIYELEVYGTLPVVAPSNLALNKPATASSLEGMPQVQAPAPTAVDGDLTTRWTSAHTKNEWLYVDLGARYDVNRVKISWGAAYAKAFDLEVSDNPTDSTSWQLLKSVTNPTLPANNRVNDLSGLSGTGRYVRMKGKVRATMWGYSIFEFEVYGTLAASQSSLATAQVLPTQSSSVADAEGLTVFPNPATTTSTVTLSGVAAFPATAEIYNAQGTRLSSAQLTQASDALNVSALIKGLYTIRVSSPQRVQTIRLQKD